jgi:hypothetical protein
MILQVLQVTILDIVTHRIGNPVSLLTADLVGNGQILPSTINDVLQPKVSGVLRTIVSSFLLVVILVDIELFVNRSRTCIHEWLVDETNKSSISIDESI